MLTHSGLWYALDEIARRNDLTPSGLARLAGLDSTALNKSKRVTSEGRLRWPSTESVAKILQVTGTSLEMFSALAADHSPRPNPSIVTAAPFITQVFLQEQARQGGPKDIQEMVQWDHIAFPVPHGQFVYILEVSGNTLEPYYSDGDLLAIAPEAPLRRGDRVLFASQDGRIGARKLVRKTLESYEFRGLMPGDNPLIMAEQELLWVHRIVWVSQ